MKKLILTSLLGLFGFFGAFASAKDYTFVGNENNVYSPSSVKFDNSFQLDSSSIVSYDFLVDGDSSIRFSNNGNYCSVEFYGDEIHIYDSNGDNEVFCTIDSSITYNVGIASESSNFSSIVISDGFSSGGDNSGSLLPGGESDLSGIITGLNSTITEFIPYLVYLGLGIITVIIGFVAVRWLINRTQAKIRGTFSSGRRRR